MYKLGGTPQKFIQYCVHGGQINIWPRGIYESDFFLIDQNSSYGLAMIGIGIPNDSLDIINMESKLEDLPFASFLKIEVFLFEEKRDWIVKPIIDQLGIRFLTKYGFDSILMTHH